MITCERLNELIKQGATIYVECWGKVKKLNLNDLECMEVEDNDVYYEIEDNTARTTDLEHLFETKEEAEWYKEFGNIVRSEVLELPSYKDFLKKHNCTKPIEFYQGTKCITMGRVYPTKSRKIYVEWSYFGCNPSYKWVKPLTKENYTLACRKCKELFLGEDNGI